MPMRNKDASLPARRNPAALVQFARAHLRVAIALLLVIVMLGVGGTIGVLTHQAAPQVARQVARTPGASLPYTEIEAENAVTNGAIIGPDYTASHLASEASGRRAVTLTHGRYVEFTLPRTANSITVRYSIPESANGASLTAPLSVYINGAHNQGQTLTLTSAYSWYSGDIRQPSGGVARPYYDEARLLLGELPAGTKVRLQVDPADTAPSYTIDLADFAEIAPPRTMPPGDISITDPAYGADPTGKTDATQAIQKAIGAGAREHKGVWAPAGSFLVTKHLMVNQVTLAGAGPWYTRLVGAGVGVYGQSAPQPSRQVHLADFAIVGQGTSQNAGASLAGVGGAMGDGSVISDVWIEHTGAGMWFDGPFAGLTVTGCRIRDVPGAGVTFQSGITNATVEQTEVRATGGDGLALLSAPQADMHDSFVSNTVQLPLLASDIAIYGGADNRVVGNLVADSVAQGGGVTIANRFGATPLSGVTTVANNTFMRAGSFDTQRGFGIGALWFYAADTPLTGKVVVSHNEIDDSVNEAIQFLGLGVTNVALDHVRINHAGAFAIQEQSPGAAAFSSVRASGLGASGVYNCGSGFTITQGPDNAGWSTTTCGFPKERGA